jgi:hypothetical protein
LNVELSGARAVETRQVNGAMLSSTGRAGVGEHEIALTVGIAGSVPEHTRKFVC